jgi:hypothetical protein
MAIQPLLGPGFPLNVSPFFSIPSLSSPFSCSYLTTWSRVLPEKLTVPQLLKKFPAFYGTRKFITAFTTARHLSLSWPRSFQSVFSSHFSNIHFNIIFYVCLGLPGSLLPSGFTNKTLYMHLFHFPHLLHALPIPFFLYDHPSVIWWGVQRIKFPVM